MTAAHCPGPNLVSPPTPPLRNPLGVLIHPDRADPGCAFRMITGDPGRAFSHWDMAEVTRRALQEQAR